MLGGRQGALIHKSVTWNQKSLEILPLDRYPKASLCYPIGRSDRRYVHKAGSNGVVKCHLL